MAFARSLRNLGAQPGARPEQGGFTLIELLISLAVLLLGVSGILGMHLTSMRATAYSRHATEASLLGEDRMEELRTIPVENIVAGNEYVNAQGIEGEPDAMYTVAWDLVWDPLGTGLGVQSVTVSWLERGFESHQIVFRTQRTLPAATGP